MVDEELLRTRIRRVLDHLVDGRGTEVLFSRSIILPEEVDENGAKASMKHGILTVRLPTMDKAKTKKLKIESKSDE